MSQISKANFLTKSRKNQETILQRLVNSENFEKFSELSKLINKETPLDIFLKSINTRAYNTFKGYNNAKKIEILKLARNKQISSIHGLPLNAYEGLIENLIEIELLWFTEDGNGKPILNRDTIRINKNTTTKDIEQKINSKRIEYINWCIYEKQSISVESFFTNNINSTKNINIELKENLIIYITNKESRISTFNSIEIQKDLNKFSKTIQNSYNSLNNDYTGVIIVKGEGACYYRSIIYNLLILILYLGDSPIELRIKWIKHLINVFQNRDITIFLESLINRNGSIMPYIEFMIIYTQYDILIITICKKLLIDFIIKNKDKRIEEQIKNTRGIESLTIKDYIIQGTNEGNVKKYCKEIIEPLNEPIHGPAADIGLLPIMLGCYDSTTILILPTKQLSIIKTAHKFYGNSNEEFYLPSPCIQLKPGHYDIFIPKMPSRANCTSASCKINNRRMNINTARFYLRESHNKLQTIKNINLSLNNKIKLLKEHLGYVEQQSCSASSCGGNAINYNHANKIVEQLIQKYNLSEILKKLSLSLSETNRQKLLNKYGKSQSCEGASCVVEKKNSKEDQRIKKMYQTYLLNQSITSSRSINNSEEMLAYLMRKFGLERNSLPSRNNLIKTIENMITPVVKWKPPPPPPRIKKVENSQLPARVNEKKLSSAKVEILPQPPRVNEKKLSSAKVEILPQPPRVVKKMISPQYTIAQALQNMNTNKIKSKYEKRIFIGKSKLSESNKQNLFNTLNSLNS